MFYAYMLNMVISLPNDKFKRVRDLKIPIKIKYLRNTSICFCINSLAQHERFLTCQNFDFVYKIVKCVSSLFNFFIKNFQINADKSLNRLS